MHTSQFLTSVTMIVAIMALLSLAELAWPLFRRPPAQRGRGTANLGLTVLTLTLNWALTSGAAIVAVALSLDGPGVMDRLGMPHAVQVAVSVVVLDFSFGYLAHWAMHRSPTLWRVHRVHHSDPFVDVTTAYRNHPIEGCWRFLFVIVPVWVLGMPAEAVVLHRLLSAINGILEHANFRFWQPLETLLSWVWVTPSVHKVHHSRDVAQTDSNYGNVLSIYDRLLRTFTSTERVSALRYGLDDADPVAANSLPRLLSMPFWREKSWTSGAIVQNRQSA